MLHPLDHLQHPFAEDDLRELLAQGITLVRRLVDIAGLRVRLPRAVRADWPAALIGDDMTAAPGTHAAGMNPHGAVWVDVAGKHLGVKPGEFHLICPFVDGDTTLVKDWRRGAKAKSCWVITPREPGLVKEARLEHLHDVTNNDARLEGAQLARIHEDHAGRTGRGPLIDGLAHQWNTDAPDGSKWADNPWTWRIELGGQPL